MSGCQYWSSVRSPTFQIFSSQNSTDSLLTDWMPVLSYSMSCGMGGLRERIPAIRPHNSSFLPIRDGWNCPVLCPSLMVPVVSNRDFRREIVDLCILSAFATTVTLSPASNLPRALSLMSALSRGMVKIKPKMVELSCNAVFIPPYHTW